MRRLSTKLVCVLALLPALMSGGCKKTGDYEATTYSDRADARYADAAAEEAPGYADYLADGEAAPSASAAAPAGGDMAGGYAEEAGAAAMDGELAPTAAPPAVGSGSPMKAARGADKGKRSEASEAKIARDDDRSEDESPAFRTRPQQIESGTLTAGSFDDNLNGWVFDRFLEQVRQNPDLAALAAALSGSRTVLKVQDAQGRPIGNATVDIDGKKLTTRSDGRVVHVRGWDSNAQSRDKKVAKVSFANSQTSVVIQNQIEQLVTLDAQGSLPSQLDIALVIDATGSMGDEMEYLKVEIRDISEAIARHFPNVDQRYALVVYRDNGDEYVTRTFDFSSNLDRFQSDLRAQQAGGGGDYPEAMDDAMEATAKLSWRGGDTARVTFLVADAPPHTNNIDDTLDAVDALRAKGVAVYPVASSGVAGEAEFVMRSAAMLTGAQYLFLTDDSGVGNPHAEPHIPCYTVEQLAPLMVRVVRSELSGKRVEAEPQYAIRTVGKGQSGVCEQPKAANKIAK